jgi:hypothetical protein
VSEIDERTSQLSPERRALVRSLLVQRARRQRAGIEAVPRDGRPLPLSAMQEELWFLQQLAPEAAMYNAPVIMRLTGELDVERVRLALERLVARHEVLRTRFVMREGDLFALVDPAGPLALRVIALARPERLNARLRRDCDRPFDLEREPGLRTALFRLSDTEHVLVLNLHHIVSDEWTEGLLWRDFCAFYRAECTATEPELPELSIQYPDFAAWQRDLLAGPAFERLADYWRGRLDGAATLDLPTDRPRPKVQTFRGGEHTFALSASEDARLRALGQGERATTFMTHLALFVLLLSRWSGQTDVTVGTLTAGREQPQLRDIAGFFTNTLVLRTDVHGTPTFRELLGRVRRASLDAHAHQSMPLRSVLELVAPKREPGRSPLFEVMFTHSPADRGQTGDELPGIVATRQRFDLATARFDLVLNIIELESGTAGAIEYNTDLFDADTISAVGLRYQELLAEIVADPDRPQHINPRLH